MIFKCDYIGLLYGKVCKIPYKYMEMYGNVSHTLSDLLVFISHSVGECRLIEVCSVVIGL